MRLPAAPALQPIIARIPAQKTYKKVGGSPFQGLIFSRHGDKLSVDSGSAASGERFQAHFQPYFSKKHVKTRQVLRTLLLMGMKYQQGAIVSMSLACWTFLCVLLAGSWRDLHVHVREASGFFYLWTLPRAQDHLSQRPPCYCPFIPPAIVSVSRQPPHICTQNVDIFEDVVINNLILYG